MLMVFDDRTNPMTSQNTIIKEISYMMRRENSIYKSLPSGEAYLIYIFINVINQQDIVAYKFLSGMENSKVFLN